MSKPKLHTIEPKPFHYVHVCDDYLWESDDGCIHCSSEKPDGRDAPHGDLLCDAINIRDYAAALTLLADAIDPKPAPKTRRKKG